MGKDEDGEILDWYHKVTYRYHNLSFMSQGRYRYERLEEIQPKHKLSITHHGPLTAEVIAKAREV